ncbi:MAG: hypothetical protein NTU61_04800 [Candidatus Altiarchaeota archaeon]|nr:hypothetical protein [Candidatus Altiarchaeota archaeon]
MFELLGIPVVVSVTFLMLFYCLYYIAHLMDWSIRTLSGNKHRVIVDTEMVCSKCGGKA